MNNISKNSSKKNLPSDVIIKFKNEFKDSETIEKLVEFSFSFKFKDISIAPIQRQIEIIQLLKILKKKRTKNSWRDWNCQRRNTVPIMSNCK